MAREYVFYISRSIVVALLITFVTSAYVNHVALHTSAPNSIKEELVNAVLESIEIRSKAQNPLDMLGFALKQRLQLALYAFIPIFGCIIYIWTITVWSWSLTIEASLQNTPPNFVLASLNNPLSFTIMLLYTIIIVEGLKLLFDLITYKFRGDSRKTLYRGITLLNAMILLIIVTVIEVVLMFFNA